MDTSKKYILMCENAREIQDNHQWQVGQLVFLDMDGGSIVLITKVDRDGFDWMPYKTAVGDIMDDGEDIWLPRQDQLQEMVKEEIYLKKSKFTLPQQLTQVLTIFAGSWARKASGYIAYSQVNDDLDKSYADTKQFTSMEQLWLAFVMKEKYNKTWNGKEWVK